MKNPSLHNFNDAIGRRVLVLDGAMGTMVQRLLLEEEDFRGDLQGLPSRQLKGCNDLLCLSAPEKIAGIHRSYLEAGADIISTNTFNANPISLGEYGLSDRAAEIAHAGAALARQTADEFAEAHHLPAGERPFVAGSMGPSGLSLSLASQEDNSGKLFDSMAEAYEIQASALIEGGVDLLLLETAFDTLNAKAAVYGIKRAFRKTGKCLPLWVSATLSENGRLLSGQSLEAFLVAMQHAGAACFGLNCGFGAEALLEPLRELSRISPVAVSVHPNAGLPDAMGAYSQTPEIMAEHIGEMLSEKLVNIVGGCCGTTPDHIRLIAERARKATPRPLPAPDSEPRPQTSATEAFTFPRRGERLVEVGERCNVAGSRKFLKLVDAGEWGEALKIAEAQIAKGADMLDINMDDGMLDAPAAMAKFIGLINSGLHTSATPLMIDSSDFEVARRALRLLQGKAIVNSISLKNGEEEFLDRAREIHDLGGAVVVMAFDEKGQADTFERKIEVCARAYELLTGKVGFRASDIVFDPNVLAVATGIEAHDRYGLDFLLAAEWIRDNLPGTSVSGGLSNLSFSFRGNNPVRKAMHSVFLSLALPKGLNMAIVDPATPPDAEWVEPELCALIEDVLLCRRPDATERLTLKAAELKRIADEKKAAKAAAGAPVAPKATQAPASPSDRLVECVVEGLAEEITPLLEKLLEEGKTAMEIVNSILMKGMDRVGEMFGRGEMYLPQVVRSASAMKKAVEFLTPVIEREQSSGNADEGSARPLMVLATVKGDVHDIGKNIVAVVMRCSGYEVVDLGVMTPAETIVEAALSRDAACIGLSGLITPSLKEMAAVAELMEKKGMRIPLCVGGAATSDLHTAVKLAPLYSGNVLHTGDAASLPPALHRLLDPETSADAVAELLESQQCLRNEYATKTPEISEEEARGYASPVDTPAPAPAMPGYHLLEVAPAELLPLVNWRAFLSEWGLPAWSAGKNEESSRLIADAKTLIPEIPGNMVAKLAILPAKSDLNSIEIDCDGEPLRLKMHRSRRRNPVDGKCLSLADFIYAGGDNIGVFAVTAARSGMPEMIEELKSKDEYRSLLLQSLSHRLAEAATEWLHRRVRTELWGLLEGSGIRPAVGYSSMPDQGLVFELDKLIDYAGLGIRLTEHGALWPSATTTGLILAHPAARYF